MIYKADELTALYFDLLATADEVLRSRRDMRPCAVSTIKDLLTDEFGKKISAIHRQLFLTTTCAKSDSHR